MFDIGAGELLIIGVVALVVIGPKELPGVLRQVGKATAKMRQMAGEFRAQFDEAMREAELEDAKKQISGIKEQVAGLNPLTDLKNEIHSSATMLNTPYTPVETASPIAPLDVSALPTVAANDTEAVKPKPSRKKAAAPSVDVATKPAGAADPAQEPAAVPKAAAKKRTAKNEPAEVQTPKAAAKKPVVKAVKSAAKPARLARPVVVASIAPAVEAKAEAASPTRYRAKKTQSGKS